jgi:aldehyde dehydrogenase family 7 protein A1
MDANLTYDQYPFLKELGIEKENMGTYSHGKWFGNGEWISSVNPHNNQVIAKIKQANEKDYEECVQTMLRGKAAWFETPIPKRGEIVR